MSISLVKMVILQIRITRIRVQRVCVGTSTEVLELKVLSVSLRKQLVKILNRVCTLVITVARGRYISVLYNRSVNTN